MEQKKIKKYFCFTEEKIAAGDYSAWDLLQPLWFSVSIYDGPEVYNKDLEGFTEEQRRLLALQWYDSEVCNGGHDQFFANATGVVWKDALEGMHMIGATQLADNFQKVIDLLGGHIPFDTEERNEMLDRLDEEGDFEGFEEMDDLFYEYEEELEEWMDNYVMEHAEKFVVDGEYDYFE